MNKNTLGIEDIIKAHQTLNKVLTFQGIPRNKNYWFDRNRKWLETHVKHWFGVDQKVIVDKYIVEIPVTPFVPPDKYAEFKKELVEVFTKMTACGNVVEICTKYEIKSNAKKGIPTESKIDFEKEVHALADECKKEVEFQEIIVDQLLDQILSNLSGDEQLSIGYMLKDTSPLEVFPGGILS